MSWEWVLTNVVLRTVTAETIGGDLKFFGSVAERQETENGEQKSNGFSGNSLHCSNVDCLGVITKPVAEIDAGDSHLVELLAAGGTGQEKGQKSVFDIAMTPWFEDSGEFAATSYNDA